MLIFSWGKQLNLIRVSEKKIMQPVKNAKTGKISEVEIGAIVLEEVSTWTTDEAILATRWLSANVSSFSADRDMTIINDNFAANTRPHTKFSPGP